MDTSVEKKDQIFFYATRIWRCDELNQEEVVLNLLLVSLLAIIANSDLRHGHEFDCNQKTSLVGGARPLKDFNSSSI